MIYTYGLQITLSLPTAVSLVYYAMHVKNRFYFDISYHYSPWARVFFLP